MAKANNGPVGHKGAIGFGLIGSLVILLCWGGYSAIGDSGDSDNRATRANQQTASSEKPATSTLRDSLAPSATSIGDGGPAETPGASTTATPPNAAPTKATATPTPKKTSAKPKPTRTTSKPKPTRTTSKPTPSKTTSKPKPSKTTSKAVYYKNCAAVRAAGKAPIYRGQPGYGKHLDRDGDGVGCE